MATSDRLSYKFDTKIFINGMRSPYIQIIWWLDMKDPLDLL
jgi:hypothetical protein